MVTREAIGKRIQEERKRGGYTQEVLAAALGLERSAVSRIEAGTQGIDTVQLSVVAAALGCPVEVFFRAPATEDEPFAVLCRAPEASKGAILEQVQWLQEFVRDYEFLRDLTGKS